MRLLKSETDTAITYSIDGNRSLSVTVNKDDTRLVIQITINPSDPEYQTWRDFASVAEMGNEVVAGA